LTSTSAGHLPIAAVILAAGAATRMGKLKQLLPYRGRTLVEHSIRQAVEAEFHPIFVVVGAEADAVQAAIAAQPIEIVQNRHWRSGMGSSIAAGIRQLQESGAESGAVAILLGDQPLVTAEHLLAMRSLLHTRENPVVAAQYQGTLGVPALFKRELFSMLASLPPDAGARHFLRNSAIAITEFPLPEAAVDIDTPTDFAMLGTP
jgi:molybdenum cofactor cytidylyltransferase